MTKLYLRHWPCENPAAVLILVHGLGEFCDRYDWSANEFVNRGYGVIGADLPGHGQSGGKRGHIRRFEELYDTIHQQLRLAKEYYPNAPLVFLGHSMGGLAITRFLQTQRTPENLKAVVMTSPCLQFAFDVPSGQLRMLRAMSRVWPRFPQSTRIAPTDVSRSAEVQTFYETNSLILHKVSVRLLEEFYDAMEAARASTAPFSVPVLVAQAGKDKLASASATEAFVGQLQAPTKVFRLYEQCHHELLNEPEREDILNDIVRWLDRTLLQNAETAPQTTADQT